MIFFYILIHARLVKLGPGMDTLVDSLGHESGAPPTRRERATNPCPTKDRQETGLKRRRPLVIYMAARPN